MSYLEIGSFEGLSASLFLSAAKDYANSLPASSLRLTCIDSWEGGIEHQGMDFAAIEHSFDLEVARAVDVYCPACKPVVEKIKSLSHPALCRMLGGRSLSYDLIYVDGSHNAADTLADIVLCWFLLKVGGIMIIDDYLWRSPQGKGALHEPKMAIDAFTSIFGEQLQIVPDAPLRQMYFVKVK